MFIIQLFLALVQQYAPELDKRCRPHLKSTNDSWRVDETYIKAECRRRKIPPPNLLVKGEGGYLYRAVDSMEIPWTFCSRRSRDAEAAKRFFRKALKAAHNQEPRVINVDTVILGSGVPTPTTSKMLLIRKPLIN